MNIRRIRKVITTFLVLSSLLGIHLACHCSGQEIGNPFIKNLGTDIYHAHSQNFAIAQDSRGIMYFGNFSGILEFDGEQWRLIPTANISMVSSLSCTRDGIIYAGARGEIGYLSPDPRGNLLFVSLSQLIPDRYRNFLDVHGTFATPSGVYFVTEQYIFNYDFDQIGVTETEGSVVSSFYVNDVLYLWIKDKGLLAIEGGQQRYVVGPTVGSGILEVSAMLPENDSTIILGTQGQGLFRLTANQAVQIASAASELLTGIQITCSAKLPDGAYAFGTERHGIIVAERDGRLRQVIDRKAGLTNDNVTSLFVSREGNLWAASNNGLVLIETPSPVSSFTELNGISGGVTGIARVDDVLFASTYQGLFRYDPSGKGFRPVSGITTGCWSIVPHGNTLLAATSKGIYQVKGISSTLITPGAFYTLCRSQINPVTVYAGHAAGMVILIESASRWETKEILTGTIGEVMEIQEDEDGSVWMNTPISGLFQYTPGDQATVVRYDTTNGLPFMTGNHLSRISTGVHLNTRQGLYRFNRQGKSFEVLPLFNGDSISRNIWLKLTVEDHQRNLWTTNGDEKGISYYRKDIHGISEHISTPFLPLSDYIVWAIYPEKQGIIWFGGPEGIIRYDPAVKDYHQEDYLTLIRKVSIKGDSTIFWGAFFGRDGIRAHQPSESAYTQIDYSRNSVLFEYAAVTMNAAGRNEYQYFLEGFDKLWSEWSDEMNKEYTNLPKGDYVFHVRSRNIYGDTSSDSTYSFSILTPWYLLWWAYLLYALIIGSAIYLIVRMRSRKLLKEKQALEEVIQERTLEVVRQKEELEQQSVELADKNYELERINKAVKAINEEIHVAHLTETVLEKMSVVQGVDKALALVRDQSSQIYRFKAGYHCDIGELAGIQYELEEAENRYLKNALEIHEDIFIKNDLKNLTDAPEFKKLGVPKSMVILVIKVEEKVEGLLLLISMTKEDAFNMRDFGFVRNSKEHIISAFIKTRILEDLQHTLENLKETQKQLIQSEKLASLGQLTAGIAHEIQNPLNFVNNFSSLSMDLTGELSEYIDKEKSNLSQETVENIEEVIGMLESNVQKINEHGKRAERIVKGMLQHSRGKSGEFLATDLNALVEEYVNLSYHGIRAENKAFNATFVKDLDPGIGKVKIVPQDFSRVILNIMNNACYAVFEKGQKKPDGYSPTISISTKKADQQIVIRIKDNGTGIPQPIIDKIFNPFFTTKPTGKGTGLGLSMSYDIITNIHNGRLEVVSTEGESTEFIITIPDIK
ncbi:MAG: ATP-binding protein [Bacteroidales bacterium]|nr:ATP-binding protein [Bacteroidales bacterium]